ncbi:MAG: P-loop NTPase [Chitinispirillaceae bacterium]
MSNPVIISVGGGKGGVGKSTVTANLGAALARRGHSVVCMDADLGGANLHTCLGIRRPEVGLQDFVSGKCRALSDVAVTTVVPDIRLISGAGDFLELANPNFAQKQKIIGSIRKLNAEFILVDLGAGSGSTVTDFFAAFPFSIMVTDSLPTSLENAYGFLKNGTFRGLIRLFPGRTDIHKTLKSCADPKNKSGSSIDNLLSTLVETYPREAERMREWLAQRRSFLIVNMVRGPGEIRVGERFTQIVHKYLSLPQRYIGYLAYTPEIRDSLRALKPVVLDGNRRVRESFDAIGRNLIALTKPGNQENKTRDS